MIVDITDAAADLLALLDAVSQGADVVITRDDAPVAKLVRYIPATTRRIPGALKGQIKIYDGSEELTNEACPGEDDSGRSRS
jgi:antitoxin (DNA-binding transcriptional repressor) of toxin-antitoxin stability system